MAKALSLIKAYKTEAIPDNGGFIISGFFDPTSPYAIYEITAYRNVKDIYFAPEGLIFKTDGNRTHILVEPPTFAKKYVEPVNREAGKTIPYRFNELEITKTESVTRLMIPREPKMLYSSFTILKSAGNSFAYVFYPSEDVYTAIRKFLADSLYNDCSLVKSVAKKAALDSLEVIKQFTIWG